MSLSRSIVHCVSSSADPLEGPRFSFGQLAQLFEIYASSGSVKGMSIRGYKLSAAACAEIGMALRSLKRKLSLLDFAYCSIGDQGAINILRSMTDVANGGEVHELVFRLCRLSPDFGKEAGRIFFHYAAKNSSGLRETPLRPFGNLRAVDLSFNALGCAGVAPVIRHAPAGIQLDLCYTGLDADACTNLSLLDVALASTEASSILLLGAGDTSTSHLFRQRHLSQTRKVRQQIVDAKCLLASDDPDGTQTVTGGVTDSTVRPDLQFCRFGAPSVTLYLDGDLPESAAAPNPREFTATNKYLASANTETEIWSERLLKEVVASVGEPICKTPAYRPGRNYPPFVRGEVAGVNRVRDGRSSTSIFSARSASCISQQLQQQRSPSPLKQVAGISSSRGVSPFNFTNTFNQDKRSASANSYVRTAAKRRCSATEDGQEPKQQQQQQQHQQQQADDAGGVALGTNTDRSIPVTDPIPSAEQQQQEQEQKYDPNGRTASVLTTLTNQTTPSTNLCKSFYRTPFERDAPPLLNPHKDTNDNPITCERERDLSAMLSSRSASAIVNNNNNNSNNNAEASARSVSSSFNAPRPSAFPSSSSIDLVASHLSARGVVKRGRCMAPFAGPKLLVPKDLTAAKRTRLMEQLLDAAVVSESQCEKIFGIPRIKDFLGPRCPPPPTFVGLFDETSNTLGGGGGGADEGDAASIPSIFVEANANPTWLLKQPAGSQQRVTGVAKLLYYLNTCVLPDQGATWTAADSPSCADLPEFLRKFGDGQRTVVQFRSQRQGENKVVRQMVADLIKTSNNSGLSSNRNGGRAGNNSYHFQQQQPRSASHSNDNSLVIG